MLGYFVINTLRAGQISYYFEDVIFKCNFVIKLFWYFVKDFVDNNPALIQSFGVTGARQTQTIVDQDVWYHVVSSGHNELNTLSFASFTLHDLRSHYSDVTITIMASNITCPQLFVQSFVKENIKNRVTGTLWEEFTGDRWIPLTKDQ